MNMTSNHYDRVGRWSWLRSTVLLAVLAVALGCLLIGCGKKPAPQTLTVPPADGQNQSQNSSAQTAAVPDLSHAAPPQLAAPSGADLQARNIHQMERVLVGWIISSHHRPKSFEEFAAATQIQVPPPPSGKKYAITKSMHIILVDSN
jgi:hypothetical protein